MPFWHTLYTVPRYAGCRALFPAAAMPQEPVHLALSMIPVS